MNEFSSRSFCYVAFPSWELAIRYQHLYRLLITVSTAAHFQALSVYWFSGTWIDFVVTYTNASKKRSYDGNVWIHNLLRSEHALKAFRGQELCLRVENEFKRMLLTHITITIKTCLACESAKDYCVCVWTLFVLVWVYMCAAWVFGKKKKSKSHSWNLKS